MKYRPIYMPASDGPEREEPLFNTEAEAWDYIHKKYCQRKECLGPGEEYCRSCEAEWMVEEVKNSFFRNEKLKDILVLILAIVSMIFAVSMAVQAIFFPVYYI